MGCSTARTRPVMRQVAATFSKLPARCVYRTVAFSDLPSAWIPELRFLTIVRTGDEKASVERMSAAVANVGWIESSAVEPGDIVVPNTTASAAVVLHRESDMHHALLLTNRCNSYCLMCSQPPTAHVDSWLLQEAMDVVRHF